MKNFRKALSVGTLSIAATRYFEIEYSFTGAAMKVAKFGGLDILGDEIGQPIIKVV